VANSNFTLKATLDEANTIRHAIELYRDTMKDIVEAAGGEAKAQFASVEAGRAETILMRDF
jgi:hypothetical protein